MTNLKRNRGVASNPIEYWNQFKGDLNAKASFGVGKNTAKMFCTKDHIYTNSFLGGLDDQDIDWSIANGLSGAIFYHFDANPTNAQMKHLQLKCRTLPQEIIADYEEYQASKTAKPVRGKSKAIPKAPATADQTYRAENAKTARAALKKNRENAQSALESVGGLEDRMGKMEESQNQILDLLTKLAAPKTDVASQDDADQKSSQETTEKPDFPAE